MKKTISIAAAAAILAAAAVPAFADAKEPRRAGADRAFAQMDADGDGKVSLEEFKAAAAARAEKRFSVMDADGDGFLSADDLKGPADRLDGHKKRTKPAAETK